MGHTNIRNVRLQKGDRAYRVKLFVDEACFEQRMDLHQFDAKPYNLLEQLHGKL
jgi:hypothetical protein